MTSAAVIYVADGMGDGDLSFEGEYLPDVLGNRLSRLNVFEKIIYAVPAHYAGKLNGGNGVFRREEKDDISFWKKVFTETGSDSLTKVYADSPFLDPEIISEMLKLHNKYIAEFTYSENLPSGFSAEIFSRQLLESIPSSENAMLPLGEVIRSNINQFDAELFYKEPDIRDKRLSFRSGEPREKRIMEKLLKTAGTVPRYTELKSLIEKAPETLFVGPSFIEVELTGRCDLDCIFCYRTRLKKSRGDMEKDLYLKLLRDLREIGLPYSVCMGGSGEPMMHKNFYEIMEKSLAEDILKNLVIETNGIYADTNFAGFFNSTGDKRVYLIVNINGYNGETYGNLHGKDYFDTVSRNILSLKEKNGDRENLYVQIMKINETESFLDQYYDFWEKHRVPVILQKQNTFLGKIQDRRYSDLSPLERIPCWHLQRDLAVLSDGHVGFCKQDIDGEASRGDLNNESLGNIWEKSLPAFLNDYKKNYPLKPDCVSCDEWYTFNL